MHADVSAPPRAPFLQTPDALIDSPELTDSALRLLQALVKMAPRNGRNSDVVARSLGMGKEKTNSARKLLRSCGHWHARKRQHPESGEIRDQRLASLTPLRTPDEVAAGWAAAEEAVRLGKDTEASRRLGVRILNTSAWAPAAGPPARPAVRPRPLEGDQSEAVHTPLPVPTRAAAAKAPELPELPPLTGPSAVHQARAERVLLGLRRSAPQLPLTVAEAAELARIAGHYLLRGESADALRAVLTHGLPPDGVRCPGAFVRQRLVRYLPPEPVTRAPAPEPHTPPPRPDGPVARLTTGGWRAALEAAVVT